jgi:hypothetical protein
MIKFFKSIFQILLLLIGILFLYMTIMMVWGLFHHVGYQALRAAPFGIIFIGSIFILISWLGLRYGLRIFKKK